MPSACIARTTSPVPSGELSSTTSTSEDGTCVRVSVTSLRMLAASLNVATRVRIRITPGKNTYFLLLSSYFSLHESVFHQHPEGDDAVLPADLLPLIVAATVVGDRHFVDAVAALEDLGGHLRLDPEAVGAQVEAVQHLAAHHLVAGLHVRQHRVVKDVGEQGQQPVAEIMSEQEDAVAAEEPGAVDDIGAAVDDQLDQLRELLRGVFEIGILNDDDVAADRVKAAADRGAFALVALLQEQSEAVAPLQVGKAVARPVGGTVVDDDQLDAQRHRQHARDDLVDGVPLVEDRHDDREQRRRDRRADAVLALSRRL